ncbi:MAG: thiamine-phosphate kinase [Methylotenera sp.]|nr:thiamine-phosphate kinase [Methylotenera sp.]
MSEFNLIAKYFTRHTQQADLGVGDDAALISVAQGQQLAISTDMLVAGTHFFHDAAAYHIGWKSLAVNVSDMAAMGAQPKWATLAIALPEVNEPWLAEFSKGFFACADAFDVDLIGGDTTKGPLTLSIQIMGEIPTGKAILRSGAKAGDDIWLSGMLGSAALGLAHLQNKTVLTEPALSRCLAALNTPRPRVALGLALRGVANSCIDISDGLTADLSHVLKASNLGAKLALESIHCDDYLRTHLNDANIQQCILAGGDDYELLFTAAKSQRDYLRQLSRQLQLPLSLIGETTPQLDLIITHRQKILNITKKGFDHFG